MNISHEIIKDLLPLYHDGICSEDSKKLIEEHLTYCEKCKLELEAIDNEIIINKNKENVSDTEVVKKLSKRWKKGMIKSAFKGAFSTLFIVIVILLIIYCFFDIRIT